VIEQERVERLLALAIDQQNRYPEGDEAREYWTGQVDVLTRLLYD
jgi:hypothetical protein